MKLLELLPFSMNWRGRARNVGFMARLNACLFGAPNARRANGVITTRFDVSRAMRAFAKRLFGWKNDVPVWAFDRTGSPCYESLPRIWISERVANTRKDDGRRVFTEAYPLQHDPHGKKAIELGDRYLAEGFSPDALSHEEQIECFKAAEVLYMHAVSRGSREAASRLKLIYELDLCEGSYWKTYLEEKAQHARGHSANAQARLLGRYRKTA